MIDLEKLRLYGQSLRAQREEQSRNLAMLDGAIQYNDQLIEELEKEGAAQPAPSESVADVTETEKPLE